MLAHTDSRGLWTEVVSRLFTDPFSLFWAATIVLGIVFFTDTHKRAYRWTAGPIHALFHIAPPPFWHELRPRLPALGCTGPFGASPPLR